MKEEWRAAPGYVGVYEVSNQGRVRRVRSRAATKGGGFRVVRERVLKQTADRRGYLRLTLCKNNKAICRSVHNLVLTAFVRPRAKDEVAMHLDNNPRNNNLANLRWGTSAENAMHMVASGRSCLGSKNHAAKLTEEAVKRILELRDADRTHDEIAAEFGVDRTAIGALLRGQTWKHAVRAIRTGKEMRDGKHRSAGRFGTTNGSRDRGHGLDA